MYPIHRVWLERSTKEAFTVKISVLGFKCFREISWEADIPSYVSKLFKGRKYVCAFTEILRAGSRLNVNT